MSELKPAKIACRPKGFVAWGLPTQRQRYDYDTDEHVISEMLTETYFSTVQRDVAPGDLIHVTDAAKERATFVVDWSDADSKRVGFSVLERIEESPVIGDTGFAIKYRGPRGGLHCIIDESGAIIEKDIRTREEAQRRLDILLSTNPKAA